MEQPSILYNFTNPKACVTGITELEPDVFYTQTVLGDAYGFQYEANSSAIWELDMRLYSQTGQALVKQVAAVPDIQIPNGMCKLSQQDGTILVADSGLGEVWRVNVRTGEYCSIFNDPSLKPIAADFPAFGANGVHVVNSTLYYSNTNQGLIGSVPIQSDGVPTGPVRILSHHTPDADDFAIDQCGNVWLTENSLNTLVRVSPSGQVSNVTTQTSANNFFGPVSAVFGRSAEGGRTLYVSTDGLEFDMEGNILRSDGKIVAYDISAYCRL